MRATGVPYNNAAAGGEPAARAARSGAPSGVTGLTSEGGSDRKMLQETLVEELALLPGRISRHFFLLATLDSQASSVGCDLQAIRLQLLEEPSAPSGTEESVGAQQLSAVRQLQLAQRRLLAEKLFVDNRATEWVSKAKGALLDAKGALNDSDAPQPPGVCTSAAASGGLCSRTRSAVNAATLNNGAPADTTSAAGSAASARHRASWNAHVARHSGASSQHSLDVEGRAFGWRSSDPGSSSAVDYCYVRRGHGSSVASETMRKRRRVAADAISTANGDHISSRSPGPIASARKSQDSSLGGGRLMPGSPRVTFFSSYNSPARSRASRTSNAEHHTPSKQQRRLLSSSSIVSPPTRNGRPVGAPPRKSLTNAPSGLGSSRNGLIIKLGSQHAHTGNKGRPRRNTSSDGGTTLDAAGGAMDGAAAGWSANNATPSRASATLTPRATSSFVDRVPSQKLDQEERSNRVSRGTPQRGSKRLLSGTSASPVLQQAPAQPQTSLSQESQKGRKESLLLLPSCPDLTISSFSEGRIFDNGDPLAEALAAATVSVAAAEEPEYFCPICNRSDHEIPSMVACDACDRWFHCGCVGFVEHLNAADAAFFCPDCRGGTL